MAEGAPETMEALSKMSGGLPPITIEENSYREPPQLVDSPSGSTQTNNPMVRFDLKIPYHLISEAMRRDNFPLGHQDSHWHQRRICKRREDHVSINRANVYKKAADECMDKISGAINTYLQGTFDTATLINDPKVAMLTLIDSPGGDYDKLIRDSFQIHVELAENTRHIGMAGHVNALLQESGQADSRVGAPVPVKIRDRYPQTLAELEQGINNTIEQAVGTKKDVRKIPAQSPGGSIYVAPRAGKMDLQ